jgi:hypothetical protein
VINSALLWCATRSARLLLATDLSRHHARTLVKSTPAMAAGVMDRLWEISDMVSVLEACHRGVIAGGVFALFLWRRLAIPTCPVRISTIRPVRFKL